MGVLDVPGVCESVKSSTLQQPVLVVYCMECSQFLRRNSWNKPVHPDMKLGQSGQNAIQDWVAKPQSVMVLRLTEDYTFD